MIEIILILSIISDVKRLAESHAVQLLSAFTSINAKLYTKRNLSAQYKKVGAYFRVHSQDDQFFLY